MVRKDDINNTFERIEQDAEKLSKNLSRNAE